MSADEVGPAWRVWLDGLTGTERGSPRPIGRSPGPIEALTAWQRDASSGQVRACFRLVEPTDPDLFDGAEVDPDEWRLEFSLQAADDPSLLIEAERVWTSRGGLGGLSRQLESPQGRC